jgi:hypothetical protein
MEELLGDLIRDFHLQVRKQKPREVKQLTQVHTPSYGPPQKQKQQFPSMSFSLLYFFSYLSLRYKDKNVSYKRPFGIFAMNFLKL